MKTKTLVAAILASSCSDPRNDEIVADHIKGNPTIWVEAAEALCKAAGDDPNADLFGMDKRIS